MTQSGRYLSAAVTSDGLFQHIFMSFGWENAPATFQRMITYVSKIQTVVMLIFVS